MLKIFCFFSLYFWTHIYYFVFKISKLFNFLWSLIFLFSNAWFSNSIFQFDLSLILLCKRLTSLFTSIFRFGCYWRKYIIISNFFRLSRTTWCLICKIWDPLIAFFTRLNNLLDLVFSWVMNNFWKFLSRRTKIPKIHIFKLTHFTRRLIKVSCVFKFWLWWAYDTNSNNFIFCPISPYLLTLRSLLTCRHPQQHIIINSLFWLEWLDSSWISLEFRINIKNIVWSRWTKSIFFFFGICWIK